MNELVKLSPVSIPATGDAVLLPMLVERARGARASPGMNSSTAREGDMQGRGTVLIAAVDWVNWDRSDRNPSRAP